MAYNYFSANNPGNIGYGDWARSAGSTGGVGWDTGHQIAVFPDLASGYAAMERLALNKYHGGATTLNQLIAGKGGWTPGNVIAAKNIANYMHISPDDDLDLTNPQRMRQFQQALTTQETGTPAQFNQFFSNQTPATPTAATPAVAAVSGASRSTVKPPSADAGRGPNEAVDQKGSLRQTLIGRGISPETATAVAEKIYPTASGTAVASNAPAPTPAQPQGPPKTVQEALQRLTKPDEKTGKSALENLGSVFSPNKDAVAAAARMQPPAMPQAPADTGMASYEPAAQLLAATMQQSAKPLSWSTAPYGSGVAGPQQAPGMTLSSNPYSPYGPFGQIYNG